MITAEFRLQEGRYQAVAIAGHAMFAEYGNDIVCASVSSALQLTVNGITEILKIPAKISVQEDEIFMALPKGCHDSAAEAFLKAFCLQLRLLEEDYPENLNLIISEA